MRYSAFNSNTGYYDVWEDGHSLQVNGDVPPMQSTSEVNGVGVPTLEAGRRIPDGARYVGQSWHAIGLISLHPSSGLGLGDDATSATGTGHLVLYGTAALVFGFLLYRQWSSK